MDRKLWFSLGGLVALPSAHAAVFDSISRSMGTAWNAVGAIFSFQYVSGSPVIQEGILKFLIFVLLLRVVMIALQKTGGKIFEDAKTSSIVGFVVAAITVIFTPNVFIFSAIILLLVPVTLSLVGWLWSVRGFKKENSTSATPLHPWISTLVLFVLLILLEFLDGNVYVAGNVAVGKMYPFTQQVMGVLILVTALLFVWKLFSAIFTIGKGINPESIANARELLDTPLIARPPGRPREVSFALKEPGSVRVTWSDPVEGENVVRYWIQHRYGDVLVGWNTIEKDRPYGRPHELVVGAIETASLDVTRAMQFRVCASGRNTAGGWGEWGYSEVRAPAAQLTRPLSENENAREANANPDDSERGRENRAAEESSHRAQPGESGIPDDGIIAPRVPAEDAAPVPPAPAFPAASPASDEEGTKEAEQVGTLEKEGADAITKATASGITPDTPPKWQDPEVRAALQTFAAHARTLRDWILQHNIFLKRDPHIAVQFRQAIDGRIAAVDEYCKGPQSTEESFRNAVVAIAQIQDVLEQVVEETLTDLEAGLAMVAHTKGAKSREYEVLDKIRGTLKKRKEKYDEFRATVERVCPDAARGINLELPQHAPHDIVALPDEQLKIVSTLAYESASRIQSWTLLWKDRREEMERQPAFRHTLLLHSISDVLTKNQAGVFLGQLIQWLRNTVPFTLTDDEIRDAIRDVQSFVDPSYVDTILPPVSLPPEAITEEGTEISEIAQEERAPITQEVARAILSNYRKLLAKSLLTTYAYPAVSRKEKLKRIDAAYGAALKDLEKTVDSWGDGSGTRAAGDIDALNKALRADLERIRGAIASARERTTKTKPRGRLASDARILGLFQGQLTQWEQVVERALADLPG